MVWWINKISQKSYESITKDIVISSTNFMINCQTELNEYDIYAFWNCGVQIFNVDRTAHNDMYYQSIRTAVCKAREVHQMKYFRPIAMALTMSLNEPVEFDENLDILILKDSLKREDLLKFKKENEEKILKMPILLWINRVYIEDIGRLIALADGVIVSSTVQEELERRNRDFCPRPVNICKADPQIAKSRFLSQSSARSVHLWSSVMPPGKQRTGHSLTIWDKVWSGAPQSHCGPKTGGGRQTGEVTLSDYAGNQRRDILPFAQVVQKNLIDGVVLEEPTGKTSDVIQSLVTAVRYLELVEGVERDCFKFSEQLKIPVLPMLAASVSACLAASKSQASAILVLTATGRSARWVACVGPPCPVLAITTRQSAAKRMHVYRKIIPLVYSEPRAAHWRQEWHNRVRFGSKFALQTTLVSNGAKLVVLAPFDEDTGYCNCFRMITVPYKCYEQEIPTTTKEVY